MFLTVLLSVWHFIVSPSRFPRWLSIPGWVLFPGSVLLAGRLVFEQTLLTWAAGPQMVGYSLVHTTPYWFLRVLFFSLDYSPVWVAAALIFLLWKRQNIGRRNWLLLSALGGSALLSYVPYNAWQVVVVAIAGPGHNASEFLTYGAATGNRQLVKLLLDKGSDPNSAGYSGSTTPLEAAARGGDERMVKLLLQRGARVNVRAGTLGTTPRMAAVSAGHAGVTRVLLEAGASPHEKDDEGRTVVDLAKRPGREKILEMLLASRPHQRSEK